LAEPPELVFQLDIPARDRHRGALRSRGYWGTDADQGQFATAKTLPLMLPEARRADAGDFIQAVNGQWRTARRAQLSLLLKK